MTIPLLPPLNRSGYNRLYPAEALREGPAYILGRPSPRYEPRWHRVRSGHIVNTVDGEKLTYWISWCGPSHNAAHVVSVDQLPDGQPLCGTCQGRAKGHIGDDGLIFSPDLLKTPRTCPSKTLYAQVGYNVGRCLACGQLAPVYGGRLIAHPTLRCVRGAA